MQSINQNDLIRALGPHDILCGRGSGPNDYRGNIKFRMLIYERREEYLASKTRRGKAQIAREIVDHVATVFDPPGRFLKKIDISTANRLGLKRGSPVWIEVNESTALEKVKQALRQNREYLAGNKISIPSPRPVGKSPSQAPSKNSVVVNKKTVPKKRYPIGKKHGLKLKSAEDVLRAYTANRNAKLISQPSLLQRVDPPCIIKNTEAFNSHHSSSDIDLFKPRDSSSDIQSVISRHAPMTRSLQTDISKILSHLAPSKAAVSNDLENHRRSFSFSSPQPTAGNSSLSFLRSPSSNHNIMCHNLAPSCATMIPRNLVSGSTALATHHLSACDVGLTSNRFTTRNFPLTSQTLQDGNSALRSHDLLSRNLSLASPNLTSSIATLISQDASSMNTVLQFHNVPSRSAKLKSQSLPPGSSSMTSQTLPTLKSTVASQNSTAGKPTLGSHNLNLTSTVDFQKKRSQPSKVALPDHPTSGRIPREDSISSDDMVESDNPLLKWTKCSDEYYNRTKEKPNIIILWRRRRR